MIQDLHTEIDRLKRLLRPAIAVVLFVLLELVACLIDIFAANYIFNTKIDFDITILQKKKSADDAER